MRTLLNRNALVKSLVERPRPSRWKLLSPASAFGAVLWPILLVGCASIESFQASPRNLCAGDTVIVTWQATGHVSLDANPSLSHTGPKNSEGSEPFTLQQTTRFVLSAQRVFSQKSAEADVVVVVNTPKSPAPIRCGTRPDLALGDRALEAEILQWMVLRGVRGPALVHGRGHPFGNGPRLEHPVHF